MAGCGGAADAVVKGQQHEHPPEMQEGLGSPPQGSFQAPSQGQEYRELDQLGKRLTWQSRITSNESVQKVPGF